MVIISCPYNFLHNLKIVVIVTGRNRRVPLIQKTSLWHSGNLIVRVHILDSGFWVVRLTMGRGLSPILIAAQYFPMTKSGPPTVQPAEVCLFYLVCMYIWSTWEPAQDPYQPWQWAKLIHVYISTLEILMESLLTI